MKQKKWSKMKGKKQKKQSEINKTNILKRYEGKTVSIYLFSLWSETKNKDAKWSEAKNTEAKQSQKKKVLIQPP
jgi:hypothetical protein